MLVYNFDALIDRRGTGCTKWDDTAARFGKEGLLPLWIADMDFPAPPCVVEAICRRAQHPIYGYCVFPSDYHDGFVAWQKKRNNWDVKKEWICHTPGVVSAISMAVQSFTVPGDSVLFCTPAYPPFKGTVEALGRHGVDAPMAFKDGRFELNFDAMEEKAKSARMLLFCNPHNPAGRSFSREELNRVAEIAEKNNLIVVCDEIHSDIVYEPCHHIPFASLNDWTKDHCVVMMAPSKTFNIAGLTTSLIVIPNDKLRGQFLRFTDDCTHIGGGSVFGLVGCQAAFEGGESWLDELRAYLKGNVDFVEKELAARVPAVKLVHPEATYVPLVDFRELGMTNEELQKFLVEKVGVALNDGASFGEPTKGFARLNVATQRAHLREFIDRLEAALKR